MTTINTHANLTDSDRFYAALLAAHEPLSQAESAAYNARLILLLANHIGDNDVLEDALIHAAPSGRD